MTTPTHIAVALPIEADAEAVVILISDAHSHDADRIVMVDAGYARALAFDLLRASEESERRAQMSDAKKEPPKPGGLGAAAVEGALA